MSASLRARYFAHFMLASPAHLLLLCCYVGFVVSGAPEQIRIFATGNPAEMVINWVQSYSTGNGIVRFRHTSEQSYSVASCFDCADGYSVEDYVSGDIYKVKLSGLVPGAEYLYQCGDGLEFSDEFSFVSVVESGSVRLGVIGDLGQTENSRQTMKYVNASGLDMILHTGDLSYADGFHPRWDTWGNLFMDVSTRIPWMFSTGNHENYDDFAAMQHRFYAPRADAGNLYWSMNFSNIHIVSLCTETDFDRNSAQYSWFHYDMSHVDRAVTPWVIVMFHRPFYTSNTVHLREGDAFGAVFEELLFAYQVDIVLNGHVHAYERTSRVYKGRLNKCGPQYFTVGDSGNREGLSDSWIDPPEWSEVRRAAYGWSEFEVMNHTHMQYFWFENKDSGHKHTDSAWIVRDFPRSALQTDS